MISGAYTRRRNDSHETWRGSGHLVFGAGPAQPSTGDDMGCAGGLPAGIAGHRGGVAGAGVGTGGNGTAHRADCGGLGHLVAETGRFRDLHGVQPGFQPCCGLPPFARRMDAGGRQPWCRSGMVGTGRGGFGAGRSCMGGYGGPPAFWPRCACHGRRAFWPWRLPR